MKILFLKPFYEGASWSSYPYALAALSAATKKLGHQSLFYDAGLAQEPPLTAFKKIDWAGVDLVAVSLLTGSQGWVRKLIAIVKNNFPAIRIVAGGPHVSALGPLALEHLGADYGLIGEGELSLTALLEALKNFDEEKIKNIPGLIYLEAGRYRTGAVAPQRIENPDELPWPDYQLIRPDQYFDTYVSASVPRKFRATAQIMTSRGCPYGCTFCATNATWGRKIKFHSPARVLEEIKYLMKNFGVREIWIGDDGFTADKNRAREICERIISEKLNFPWRLPNGVRLDTLDDELAALMKKAGCYLTGVGIETGSPETMSKIKKNLDLKIVGEKILLLKKNGILTSGFFMIGFPEETESQAQETLDLLLSLPLDRMQISIFAPYPGSPDFYQIFDFNHQENYEKNVRRYLNEQVMPEFLKYLTVDRIQKFYRTAYLRFYLRPAILAAIGRQITGAQIKDLFKNPALKKMFFRKASAAEIYVKMNN